MNLENETKTLKQIKEDEYHSIYNYKVAFEMLDHLIRINGPQEKLYRGMWNENGKWKYLSVDDLAEINYTILKEIKRHLRGEQRNGKN